MSIAAHNVGRPWRVRPMPDDFHERASSGATLIELMEHYSAGAGVMRRWLDEFGDRPRAKRSTAKRATPDDFAQYGEIETVVQLIRRYGCGTATVTRWRRELGMKPVTHRPARLPRVPDGFALVAPTATMRDLKVRYGKGKTTIWKWCQAAGVQPRKASTHSPKVARPTGNIHVGRKLSPFGGPHRDVSRAGMAAEFLRKFAPVVRCNSAGHYSPDGDHWRRGSSVLSADEIIARAIRNGWQPDGWKQVA